MLFFLSRYLWLSLLFITPLLADESSSQKVLETQVQRDLLQSIRPYAITFGQGETELHIFIDPYCHYSQDYLEAILQQDEQKFQENSYFFYLYEIYYTDATEIIQTIMVSDDREKTLTEIMVTDTIVMSEEDHRSDYEIEAIADVARELGVDRRPFIITIKK